MEPRLVDTPPIIADIYYVMDTSKNPICPSIHPK